MAAPDVDMVTPAEVDGATVTFLDDVPESGNPGKTANLHCVVCDTPLTYGGRGPKPKYCDEHKKNKPASSTGRASNSGTVALIDRAVSELTSAYSIAGGLAKYVDPITGECIGNSKDALAESWRPLLETNKKLRDMFAKTENGMAYVPLLVAHGDLIVTIMFARMASKQIDLQGTDERL